MKGLVLVDTSVFVEYLRGEEDDTLSVLILNNQVLLSPIVKFELLAGVRKQELSQLERLLSTLVQIDEFNSIKSYEKTLTKAKGSGLLGGLPDLMILTDALVHRAVLFSLDEKMIKLAKRLRVEVFDRAKSYGRMPSSCK